MELKWIKITTDIFDNKKIKYIESLPDGDTIVVIWFKLLSLAGQCNDNGLIYIVKNIPYEISFLAEILNRKSTIIEFAIKLFVKLKMIEIDKNYIAITNWEKHQSVDKIDKIREQNKIRQEKYRSKQKRLIEDNLNNDKNKKENVQEIIKTWNELNIIKHSEKYIKNNLKQKYIDIIIKNGKEEVISAMKIYKEIISSNKYFFNKKWTLFEFLSRGLLNFLAETNPKDRYINLNKNKVNNVKDTEYEVL